MKFVVVDNHSTDQTPQVVAALAANHSQVRYAV